MTLQARVMAWVVMLALVLGAVAPVGAQTARKPSPYEYRPGNDAAAQPAVGPDYLSRIDGREQFMQLARIYNAGTALEMPHLIFVIDRQNAARPYYINTPRFELHENFVRRQGLVRSLDKATLNAQYRDPQRRFLFGTVSWQKDLPGVHVRVLGGRQAHRRAAAADRRGGARIVPGSDPLQDQLHPA